MPVGPGKYDALCGYVRDKADARAAIVIIVDGINGHGFSVQADADITPGLPALLDQITAELRKSLEKTEEEKQ